MRRAARIDDNHAAIVKALRQIPGVSVLSLAKLGDGCPDLLIGRNSRNVLIELKDGAKAASRCALTNAQEKFRATWQGQWAVATNIDDVLRLVGL